jgi:hypothetical protein
MAGPPFEAGSILIALRASAENLQKEIGKANQTLQQFGKEVQTVATKTEQTTSKVVDGFSAIDRKTLQLTARIAQFSQRLLGLQFILQSFAASSGQSGEGLDKFREKTQGAVAALTTFAGIVTLFPNKIGLIVGAIAALAILIADLVKQFNQASEAVKRVEQAAADIDKLRADRLKKQSEEEIRINQLRLAGVKDAGNAEQRLTSIIESQKALAEEITKTEAARLQAVKDRAEVEARITEDIRRNPTRVISADEFGNVVEVARNLGEELADNKEISRLTQESTKLGAALGKAREEFIKFGKEAEDIQNKVKLDEKFDDAIKAFIGFGSQAARVKVQLEQGLLTPAEAASAQLSIARAELETFIALGANASKRIGATLIDTKPGESAFDALTRRVLELQAAAKGIEIKALSETELRKSIEAFRQIGVELDKVGRDVGAGLLTPAQGVEAALTNARDQLRAFLDATQDQQLQIAVEVLGVDSAEEAIQRLTVSLQEAEEAAKQIKLDEQQAESFREFQRVVEATPEALGEVEARLKKGFITPLQAAEQRARLLEDAIIRVGEAASKVEGPRLSEALEEASVEVDRLLSELEKDRQIIADVQIRQDFQESFAEPFSAAVGDAITRGILEGQDAMEVLANVGENLFTNFLNDAVAGFQKGMTAALTAVAGAGGEALGGLLSAAVGIAGFFLSGRDDQDTNQSFNDVNGQVESTQAVRGVVAGPESVSIAAVGENLRRAMVGVEARLDALIRVSVQIRDGQGVGGTSDGTPYAGSVPTS